MRRPQVISLPGNSTKEQSFYDQQVQPVMPGPEWPGPTAGPDDSNMGPQARPDPSPFKLGGR